MKEFQVCLPNRFHIVLKNLRKFSSVLQQKKCGLKNSIGQKGFVLLEVIIQVFGGGVSKHGERIARIAGVLTVFEESDLIVSEKIMESAIELGKWHLLESIRIIGAGSLKPEINDAFDLIEWFRKNTFRLSDNTESGFESTNNEFEITKGVLQQFGPIKIRNKTMRDSALKVLAENHWLKIVKMGQRQIIKLNPVMFSNV